MYHEYFGLTEAPFSIAVNPRYLFMSARHRDALAHLLYGVGTGGGFILLTGEVGTGKTTINRALMEQLPQDTDIAIILNPALNALELLATACDELDIDYDSDNPTLKTLTDSLHAYLLANHTRGRNTVLMIDEAQHLGFEVLEQIRLLTNLETNTQKLLQIILIGQPELVDLLNRPELRQLNQRITARYNLEPLNLEETSAYIRHRLQVAGLAPGRELFPAGVVRGIFKRSRGIPRLINVLCDRMLMGAYGRNKMRADLGVLKIAAREVMGDESPPPGEGVRPWMLLAGAVILVGAGLSLGVGLWFGGQWWQAQSSSVAAGAPKAPVTIAALVENAVAPSSEPVPRSAVMAAQPDLQSSQPAWLLPSEAALEQLWLIESSQPAPEAGCVLNRAAGIDCVRESAQTWESLRGFNRPVALQMVTPDRFGASALLLGIVGGEGYVYTAAGVSLVGLAQLGPLWSGDYYFLWRPPQDFELPLAMGDDSPVVARVAALFAQLDGQETALANNQFNRGLKARVMLFQQRHGLEDDGVVGVKTLLRLNEQLGIDMTTSQARSRMGLAADDAQLW